MIYPLICFALAYYLLVWVLAPAVICVLLYAVLLIEMPFVLAATILRRLAVAAASRLSAVWTRPRLPLPRTAPSRH